MLVELGQRCGNDTVPVSGEGVVLPQATPGGIAKGGLRATTMSGNMHVMFIGRHVEEVL